MTVHQAKVPISVIVPVLNEANNLPRCLASVQWADEVFVVDSGSSDDTPDVAASLGAHVVQFKYSAPFPKKKNWALANLPFKHEWIFILDADEELLPEAEKEIDQAVRSASDQVAGYWINRRYMFMGKWLKHAYYPNWNLRLFKHKFGRYEKLTSEDTASGDNEVHEHVIIDGATAHLKTEMNHYAFPSVDVFMEKHNRYSNWEAVVALEGRLGGTGNLSSLGDAALKRRLKSIFWKLPGRPVLRFAWVYLWQKGFLDGIEGFYFALLHGVYEILVLAKTYELKKKRANNGQ